MKRIIGLIMVWIPVLGSFGYMLNDDFDQTIKNLGVAVAIAAWGFTIVYLLYGDMK